MRLLFQVQAKARLRPLTQALLLVLATVLALTSTAGVAASQAIPLTGNVRDEIERLLLNQMAGLPGKVGISIDTPLSGPLPACAAPEPFLPSGARLWGRVSVGVRCNDEQPWTRYVSTYIAVVGAYYVAAHAINAGQTITLADAQLREGDLTALPGSVIVDPSHLNGVTAANRIASGAPLRRELLRSVPVVKQGQTVKVVTRGTGFVVSTEGKAMSNGSAGAMIQVKMQGGQVIGGIVRADGMVERPP